jgi:hypothetical protein
MLKLGGDRFTQGRITFRDQHPEVSEPTAKIYVPIFVGDLDVITYAQLDTGAAWSVLDPAVAMRLGILGKPGFTTNLTTHLGRISGRLVRLPVRFLSDQGEPFETEGTFFVSPDCPPGRTFLGYSGLLESIRFALDPQVNHFYFGPGL